MAWTFKTGIVKASIWPDAGNGTCWNPTDEEADELAQIDDIEEISSDCAQPYKIIVKADSIEELQTVIEQVTKQIEPIIKKYAPQRRIEAAELRRLLHR